MNEITVYNFRKKLDKFLLYKGFGVLEKENKEFYITKDTPISKLVYKENLLGSDFADYNKDFLCGYKLQVKDAVIVKYIILKYELGSNEKHIVNIEVNTDYPNIRVVFPTTNTIIFEGNGKANNEVVNVTLLKEEKKHKQKIIRGGI